MKRILQPIPPTIQVDPGAGYSTSAATGIIAIIGTEVVWSTNVHRRQGERLRSLVMRTCNRVEELHRLPCPAPGWTTGVEDVVTPRGYINGRRSSVTHDQILGITAIAYGVWGRFKGKLVMPCKAGLAHVHACDTPRGRLPCLGGHPNDEHCPKEPIEDYYPPEVRGRRPALWPAEVGTREHEQESFDLAFALWEQADLEGLVA